METHLAHSGSRDGAEGSVEVSSNTWGWLKHKGSASTQQVGGQLKAGR